MTPEEKIYSLERPHPSLMRLYLIRSLFAGPFVVLVLPLLYFRYQTLRYRFDDEGIHMRWGILFRQEINLTYARIQDIHLRSGIIQRWLGLADLLVQTASGSAGPEMTIEGFKNFEAIRDFLYTRMRGYDKAGPTSSTVPSGQIPGALISPVASGAVDNGEMVRLLGQIREELRGTRELLEKKH
ncbi:MAG: PH domain-containing protein, partial [Verrucomicrobiota bacterium]